ncbi:MAG TPA: aminotransferase class I/II-fold pyridoxal phosphate-dependent enzyme [Enteractinococcus helveticum]|uniref:Aminotransferase class I/II-fold pyridoxal phosphate-dependent enzyme n=1 Tax=Enteractinococcus helveticum TaxID=1837282 RepID=A0A921FQ75_9MICC|nr:aminotransferase class I/II-fold pyridoxal phosphate-dependent enzyme [Enteractinococcus helveticum]HJF15462.1 aminotransferase class I/II-fold pyridoxal phosphate-dependent enzyme [Enteractinococcus helveticum]
MPQSSAISDQIASITAKTAAEIAEAVRDLVDAGQLAPGASLPPVRALAEHLEVNRNTVVAAYGLLVQAGVAVTRGRAGTKIVDLQPLPQEGFSNVTGLIDIASGNPDPALLPAAGKALAQLAADEPVLYGQPVIDPDLAKWAHGMFAQDVGEAELTITAGSADAVQRLLADSLTIGDAVGFEQPCFLTTIQTAQAAGYRPIPMPVDAQGLTVEGLQNALNEGIRALVVTPRAHNPTGAVISAARAQDLSALLADHPHVLIIEDDHFWQVSNHSYRSIIPANHPRWALVRSVSKSLGPDLRVGLVGSDKLTASRLGSHIRSGAMWVSHLLQRLTYLLITHPDTPAQLAEAAQEYAHANAQLIDALAASKISATSADGVNVWINLRHRAAPVVDALAARGWLVRDGAEFSLDSTDDAVNHIRVTIHQLTPAQRKEFVADLVAVL